MATRTLDELKTIKKEVDESAIRKAIIDFFDEMDVDDVNKRTALAINLERIFRDLFYLAIIGETSREELIARLISEYSQEIVASGYRPNYAHIERVCEDVVDNTLEKIETPYMTSTDRSILIAETETNNVANNDALEEAKANGMTEKIWVTMADPKVRLTHMAIDGMIIGIDDLFEVGEAQMRFPCDEELAYDSPQETVNCRCHLEFQ